MFPGKRKQLKGCGDVGITRDMKDTQMVRGTRYLRLRVEGLGCRVWGVGCRV